MVSRKGLKVFSGSSNPKLARDICSNLMIPFGSSRIERFPDGEINVKIDDDVRGADVFIIQSTCPPVNEHLMELLILIDAIRRASADRITAVLPYYGYARKDRKDEGRVPITAKLVANIITTAGVNRVLTLDLHAAQIQGFFDIPVDHLTAAGLISDYFKDKKVVDGLSSDDVCIVAPDVGSSKMAFSFAEKIGGNVAIIEKRRINSTLTEALNVVGDVEDKHCIFIDDMIATGGSMVNAAAFVRDRGAKTVGISATHAVFAGNAYEKLLGTDLINNVVVTDTIPLDESKLTKPVTVLTVAPILAEVIRRIHLSESVSIMFDNAGRSSIRNYVNIAGRQQG
ncbi:MAG: ribose-phosphate pyrophosphokinase [Planctomycetes bacterium]|nr:ribose-phosphate pyrophosphokinase [Planctomycetota bacterium]